MTAVVFAVSVRPLALMAPMPVRTVLASALFEVVVAWAVRALAVRVPAT